MIVIDFRLDHEAPANPSKYKKWQKSHHCQYNLIRYEQQKEDEKIMEMVV
jgi:hypothetical protein